MEVVLQLRNFSFYTSSETVYIQGTVLSKKDRNPPKAKEHFFENIKPGSKINCKYPCSDPEKLNYLFTERLLRIHSQDVVIPDDPNRCVSFAIDKLEKCEI